jgi:single-stranded-DNA-specific exonuclease
MTKITVRKELSGEEREKLNKYSDIVAHLLFHREIKDSQKAEEFLNPEYKLHDPFLFHDMEKAVDQILESIQKEEKICIYSDYDADGIPGAVVLNDFFEKIGYKNFFTYIPHRNKEGFGLNKNAIEKIKEEGTDLIITIDCGIADEDEVELANSLSMKVIITDHHEPNGKAPKAVAIVDHKKEECNYPDKNLCGSGVIFKVVQGLISKGEFDISEGWEKWLLDLVGIATLSDMVDLKGENRVFATYGLKVLKKTKRKGIQKIFEKRKVDVKNLNETDVVFMITPQINAASRMGDPIIAYNLLKETDEGKAEELVKHLGKINNERRGQVAAIVKDIKKHLGDSKPEAVGYGHPDWQPSLLGLACNSIAEEYKIPVLLWGRGDGKELKGSCRTGNGDNLVEIMNKLADKDILGSYGGHHGAGGFVIKSDKVDFLQESLDEIMKNTEIKEHEEVVDRELKIEEIDLGLIEEINRLAPFGIGNSKPVFYIKNITPESFRGIGQTGAHLEITFRKNDKETIKALEFYKTADDLGIQEGKPLNLLVNLEINSFNGRKDPRINILKILD